MFDRLSFSLSGLALSGIVLASPLAGQAGEGPARELAVGTDTGSVSVPAGDPGTVAAFHVFVEGAVWMRVFFDQVELAPGAELRITSLADGQFQTLDEAGVARWGGSSAYFNGDLLLVEVVAGAQGGSSRVAVERVRYGLVSLALFSLCGADDRQPTTDSRIARLMPSGCTGFMIDDECGCLLGAGHCMNTSSIVQFDVPLSNPDGSLRHPPPSDQYAIDPDSVQTIGGQGVGEDWAYFGVERNTTTGVTARGAQGPGFTFGPAPAWNSQREIRISGHGIDLGAENQILQTSTGPWLQPAGGNSLEYLTDTQGGNSGGPIVEEATGIAVGIHTHGGCAPPGEGNQGTIWSHPGLQAALADPKGTCTKPGFRPRLESRNGSGVNGVLLSAPPAYLGQGWDLTVDASGHPGAGATVTRCHLLGSEGSLISAGELLIDLASPKIFSTFLPASGGADVHALTIPLDPSLAGVSATVQAAVLGGAGAELTNALDFVVGCSPAICPD